MNRPELILTFEKDFARPVQLISEAEKRRTEIEEQVNKFLIGGGAITNCKPCTMAQSNYIPNEFDGRNDAEIRTKHRQEGAKILKKATMNSKFNPTSFANVYKSDADKTKFVVIIRQYISKQFKTAISAVNHRDWKLSDEKESLNKS